MEWGSASDGHWAVPPSLGGCICQAAYTLWVPGDPRWSEVVQVVLGVSRWSYAVSGGLR